MNKTKYGQVAKIFDLKLGEKFRIKQVNNSVFMFVENGLLKHDFETNNQHLAHIIFLKLLSGEYEIKK